MSALYRNVVLLGFVLLILLLLCLKSNIFFLSFLIVLLATIVSYIIGYQQSVTHRILKSCRNRSMLRKNMTTKAMFASWYHQNCFVVTCTLGQTTEQSIADKNIPRILCSWLSLLSNLWNIISLYHCFYWLSVVWDFHLWIFSYSSKSHFTDILLIAKSLQYNDCFWLYILCMIVSKYSSQVSL